MTEIVTKEQLLEVIGILTTHIASLEGFKNQVKGTYPSRDSWQYEVELQGEFDEVFKEKIQEER